jgi:hypothetical protein
MSGFESIIYARAVFFMFVGGGFNLRMAAFFGVNRARL